MIGTYALLVAMVALFLALVLLLALIAYDLVVIPPWEEIAPVLVGWLAVHTAVVDAWIAEYVTGAPSGRHSRPTP